MLHRFFLGKSSSSKLTANPHKTPDAMFWLPLQYKKDASIEEKKFSSASQQLNQHPLSATEIARGNSRSYPTFAKALSFTNEGYRSTPHATSGKSPTTFFFQENFEWHLSLTRPDLASYMACQQDKMKSHACGGWEGGGVLPTMAYMGWLHLKGVPF